MEEIKVEPNLHKRWWSAFQHFFFRRHESPSYLFIFYLADGCNVIPFLILCLWSHQWFYQILVSRFGILSLDSIVKTHQSDHFYNPIGLDRLFRRCIVCPTAFTGSCPLCNNNEICSLARSSCDQCANTFCVNIVGSTTVTVSLGATTTVTALPSSSFTSSSTALPKTGQRQDTTSSERHTNVGAVAGIVLGSLLVLILLLLGTLCLFCGRKRRQKRLQNKVMEQRQSYTPAGGRYELDPNQAVHPHEVEGSATIQIHEIDGREKPVEVGWEL